MDRRLLPRLAVLIDGDNYPVSATDFIFLQVRLLGDPLVRRLYGNVENTASARWSKMAKQHALTSRQQFATSAGKNAADIAMVIDAMDILATSQLDGFCIVSSDGDFTALAIRLQEAGKLVYGFGQSHAPYAFRRACDHFIEIDGDRVQSTNAQVVEFAEKGSPKEVAPHLRTAIREMAGEGGWATLSAVGIGLRRARPDFCSQDYGARTLSVLIEKLGGFEIGKPDGHTPSVRLIQAKSANSAQANNNKSTPAKAIAPRATNPSI